ncbi:MAG: ATP-binding cassette domain-containing protein, partial [Planctomycetes bacterium]|nr:ATP-binding cassette domain-containing protein [Planctomycetota bacterium]
MIAVNNLQFAYGNGFSISIDHLSIQPGENVVLTGPNGAGKTTILKLLAGLLQPHHGQVIFNGVNLRLSASHYHRRIGYVPQKPVLYNRTVADNVAL